MIYAPRFYGALISPELFSSRAYLTFNSRIFSDAAARHGPFTPAVGFGLTARSGFGSDVKNVGKSNSENIHT